MKILIVNWQDIRNPLAGGAEVHLHEVFSRIARMGHDVTLYCSTFSGAPSSESLNGIKVFRQGGRNFFNYRFLLTYLRRFKRAGFDIIIDDMNKIPFLTPLYVKQPLYGVTHHLFGRSIFLEVNFVFASYVYAMESLAVRVYKHHRIPFIVGSPSTRQELLERGFSPERISLIPYGVDHRMHRQTGVPKSTEPLVGYFGRLKRYKSVDHLIAALPGVRRQVPSLRLLIVGEGDDRPRLEAMANELGLSNVVEFTGFVSEEKKLDLLQQMWFKVTTSSKEGWGLTVVEANACGTPVLASNVPGLRDAVRENETGLLYKYGDIEDLTRKMVLLLQDEQLRNRLARNALEWAKRFDWETAAEETLELLEKRIETLSK